MIDVAVIGAGISGLATAWALRQQGRNVIALEAGPQPGGAIQTHTDSGFLIEAGPNSTLNRGAALDALINALGLQTEVVEANPLAARRYIVRDQKLLALPAGPLPFLTTPVFSPKAKLRMLLEPFIGRADHEESIADFVTRRLGPEFLDWAIDPFVSGVYAGDPKRLSARAATAKVYALEAQYRSLFVGALARLLQRRPSGPQPSGRLISFRSGMHALPRAVAAALGEALQLACPVYGLSRQGEGWRLQTREREIEARQVVLAAPSHACAQIVAGVDELLADTLRDIRYAPVASVALGFSRADVVHPLDGFGVLLPSRLDLETLGALFSSTLFPQRAPPGQILLTAFIGGARNPGILGRDPEALVQHVVADLRPLLGIRGAPTFQRVTVWPKAIPQYELGHLQRIERIDALTRQLPGLHFRANWRDGISVADCVVNGTAMANAVARKG